jgi:hypothetical protein
VQQENRKKVQRKLKLRNGMVKTAVTLSSISYISCTIITLKWGEAHAQKRRLA